MQWLVVVCKDKSQVLETLHHHRGQADVTTDLQGSNVLEVKEAVVVVVGLHPIGYNPKSLPLTNDGQLKEKQKAGLCHHLRKNCISA